MTCSELELGIKIHIDLDRNPNSKKIQPPIKKTPPKGVIIPRPVKPIVLVAFKKVSMYKDPENSNMPSKKQ